MSHISNLMVGLVTIIITIACLTGGYISVNRLLKGPDWRFGFLHSYLLWGFAGVLVVFGFLSRLGGGLGFALEAAGLDLLIWAFIGGIGPSVHFYASIFKTGKKAKDHIEENPGEVWEATGAALETTAAVTGAAADYKNEKEKKRTEKERKEKKERQQKKRERERQRKQDKREQMESDVSEVLSEADNPSSSVFLKWNMNCPKCGIQWATSHRSKLLKSDDYDKHNFKIVNDKKYSNIQDRVRVQCEAPDCNHTDRFTKDSLW